MRNKVIPFFIFFGLGKLNAADEPSLRLSSFAEFENASNQRVPNYSILEKSPTDSVPTSDQSVEAQKEPIFSGQTLPLIGSNFGFRPELEPEGSIIGSSYPGESSATSILANITHRSFKKMITPLIESDNGDKANQIRINNSQFFKYTESMKLGASELSKKNHTSMLEIYESENLYPLANKMYSIPLNMIMTDDLISGRFFLYNPENPENSYFLPTYFLPTEIPGIEALTKSAMHLIFLYRFELSPCEVYTRFTQDIDRKDQYYQSFIVVRDQKAYLLTHSGAEELDQNPIAEDPTAEEEIAVRFGNEISLKNNQPIHLFSINLCGDIYRRSDKLQFQSEKPLIDDNLIAKGVEILSLLSYACHTKLTEKGIEFGRGSILKKLPVVGPLSFFVESQDLKIGLINSLKDFWTKKTKKPTKTIRDFSKFLTNPNAFQITEPNFENIAQEAIKKFKILFPQVVKEDLETVKPKDTSKGMIGGMMRRQSSMMK